jgi:hypothetical protein
VFGETGDYKQRAKDFHQMRCSSLTTAGTTETHLNLALVELNENTDKQLNEAN